MLGSLSELEHLYKILDNGTSADRQLQVYEETKSLEAVVDHVLDETVMGVL
jgi:carboxylate-amine ligase